MDLSAVILAGGQSRRMGRDKAWLELDGRPLIARAEELVRILGVREIFISGRVETDYSLLGCPVLLDERPGLGPLAGIERALQSAGEPLLLVLAVDLPRMTPAFLNTLIRHCQAETGAVPERAGMLEPLAAVYPKRNHALAVEALNAGRSAARDFAEACAAQGMVRKFPILPSDARCFDNWNSLADVEESTHRPGQRRSVRD